jgi:hypothetical protein
MPAPMAVPPASRSAALRAATSAVAVPASRQTGDDNSTCAS